VAEAGGPDVSSAEASIELPTVTAQRVIEELNRRLDLATTRAHRGSARIFWLRPYGGVSSSVVSLTGARMCTEFAK